MVILRCDSLLFEFDMEGQKPDTRESLITHVFGQFLLMIY